MLTKQNRLEGRKSVRLANHSLSVGDARQQSITQDRRQDCLEAGFQAPGSRPVPLLQDDQVLLQEVPPGAVT